MENDLEEDVSILSRLLEEKSDRIRTKLWKYATEDQHMRMQLMLRDYFREEKVLMKPDIKREARSIAVIFPDIPIEIIQDMLVEIGNLEDRSRIVIKNLCTKKSAVKSKNSTKLITASPNNISAKVDDNENKIINGVSKTPDCDDINKVQFSSKSKVSVQLQRDSQLSTTEPQPSTSSYVCSPPYVSEIPTFHQNLYDRALEVFPDACPQFLRNLCERKNFTEFNLAEVVQSLLDGDYPKRF